MERLLAETYGSKDKSDQIIEDRNLIEDSIFIDRPHNSNSNSNSKSEIQEFKNSAKELSQSQRSACRICLGDTFTDDFPLITPCNCTGSLEYVHLQCLKYWIASRINMNSEFDRIFSIDLEKMKCELCGGKFPLFVNQNGMNYDLLSMDAIRKKDNNEHQYDNYIILEVFSEIEPSTKIYFIDFSENKRITLGRSYEVDIKLKDISVSRKHSAIYMEDSNFFIQDLESKFGTLIRVNESISIKTNQSLQVGNTIFRFKIRKSFRAKLRCLGLCNEPPEKPNELFERAGTRNETSL